MKLVHCNKTILESIFKQKKHFELKCREKNKAIASWFKKIKQNSGRRTYFGQSSKKNLLKDVTRDTSYLVQDNQTFLQHLSMTVYFLLSIRKQKQKNNPFN